MNVKNKKHRTLFKPYIICGILLIFYFTVGAQKSLGHGLYFMTLFTVIQLIIYQINNHQLIPRLFDHNSRKFYILNIFLILLVVNLSICVDHLMNLYIFKSEGKHSILFPFFLHSMLCFIALWVAISQHLMEKEKKNKIEIEELKREKAENELRFLKMQINPHFLFNALNNIYTMSYIGDQSAPEKIAMLSNMLRYVLYDCESSFIPIYKEVDYLENFIAFQQLKTENAQNITFSSQLDQDNYPIAPMLLIPFVENAFKHSKIEKDTAGFVKIELIQEKQKLLFNVRNSIFGEGTSTTSSTQNKGIGIENVKSRLQLLYGENYFLTANKKGHQYTITLELRNHGSSFNL